MAVSKEFTRLPKSAARLTLTVDNAEVKTQYQQVLADLGKRMQLPGFRKGKVPPNIVERKLGEAVKYEAVGHIIEESLRQAFDGEEALPRGEQPLFTSQPALEGEPALNLDTDFVFSVTYDVTPEIPPVNWKGHTVEVVTAEVTDSDIARELEEVRERNAIVLDRDDAAAAAKGDVVTVNYHEIDGDGNPVAGTKREDFVFTLGSGNNIYQFDDEITGMKKGEERSIEKTYAADDEDPENAGKTKKLIVRLTALKEKQLPALDDELAQDVDEKFKTINDLKNSIRERLQKTLSERLLSLKLNAVMEKIQETAPVEVPPSMVEFELRSRFRRAYGQFTQGDELERLVQGSMRKGDELGDSLRTQAAKELHIGLLTNKIVEEQKIEATDDEITREIAAMAAEDGSPPLEELTKYYEVENARDQLAESVKLKKLHDLLLAENTIKPGKKVNYLDLVSDNS